MKVYKITPRTYYNILARAKAREIEAFNKGKGKGYRTRKSEDCLLCKYCEKSIHINDEVATRLTGTGRIRIYHKKCACKLKMI